MAVRSRGWVFTLNNYTVEDEEKLSDGRGSMYLLYGKEIGEEGTPHLQGYIYYKSQRTFSAVKKKLGDRFHIEKQRGTIEEAVDYCKKDGSIVELGTAPMSRKRKGEVEQDRWESIWDAAKEGRVEDIPARERVMCYNKIRKIEKDYMKPVAVEKEVYVYWGSTETGKSRTAWAEAGFDAFPKIPTKVFWDGYQGQEHVVIEEFRGLIGISHMLTWLDRYPVIVENKGGACVLKAKKVWITSNLHPKDWYPDLDEETMKALLRRLKITHFTKLQ